MALWNFVTELDEKLREVNSCGVWIADDLTVVAPRNQCGTIIRYIRAELPKYNMETSSGKLYSYLVGPPHSHYSDLLRGEGFRVNNDGLQRLLGAPIGTRQFQIRSAADGGHLAIATRDATNFVAQIGQIQHIQARYHLLRWSACSLMLHFGRLVAPHILSAYAMQFSESIEASVHVMLAAKSLTTHQLQMIRLPTKHSGLGLGGPLDTMHQA